MPVLPLVGSTMVSPGLRRPSRSAASTMATAMRSLTLPPGLRASSFPSTAAAPAGTTRLRRTRGVRPISSSTLAATSMSLPVSLTAALGCTQM